MVRDAFDGKRVTHRLHSTFVAMCDLGDVLFVALLGETFEYAGSTFPTAQPAKAMFICG